MRLAILGVALVIGVSVVGCSTDDCDEKDAFGQKKKQTPEQQAECKPAEETSTAQDTSTSQETASGGGTSSDTSSASGTDSSGSNNTASSGSSNTGSSAGGPDTVPPTIVSFVRAASQAPTTNQFPIMFTVVFSEPIIPSTLLPTDITNVGTATGVTWMIQGTGDQKTFTIQATQAANGSLKPRIALGSYTDAAGNPNQTIHTASNDVAYATGAVLVSIGQAPGQPDPTTVTPINFRIVFSRPINPATFTTADIVQSGSAGGITWSLSTSDNMMWNLSATQVSFKGTIIPMMQSNAVLDPFGNGNAPATATDNSVMYQ